MNAQPYQEEIATVILHTLAALDDVRIDRFIRNNQGQVTGVEKKIDVPLKYGPKTRTLADLLQKNRNHSFPFMALSFDGVNRDNDRNRQKDAKFIVKSINPEGGYKQIHTPVPVSLNMTLEIVSVFEEDLLQILNNYLAYFNPYISVSWKEPFSGQELITKVSWNDSASYDVQTPLPGDQKDVYRSTMSLTVESWIFREEQDDAVPIRCFDMDFYALSSMRLASNPPSGTLMSNINFCADPCVWGLRPTCVSAGDRVTIYGQNMDNVDAVFLLGASSVIPQLSSASSVAWCSSPIPRPTENYYDLYQHNRQLSATNTAFYGLAVTAFNIVSEHSMTVDLPADLGRGFADIRLASLQAGYTDITDAEAQPGCLLYWTLSGLLVGASSALIGSAFSLGFDEGFGGGNT